MNLTTSVRIVACLVAWHWGQSGLGAQKDGNTVPAVEELTLTSKIFRNTRTIRVFLPPRYSDSAQINRRYPVFYFTDGIAVFHGRKLVQIAKALIEEDQIPPMIFVGIDNGGSTRESKNPGSDRANEYLPFQDTFLQPPLPSPQGGLFPKFLAEEVQPMIDSKYRTSQEIGLGGSSYGAEIALYTVMAQSGRYRWLYLESPSLYVHNDELLRRSENFKNWPERIYVGAGTAEGANGDGQEMIDDVKRFSKMIEHQTKSCLLIVEGAHHEEEAWRARLPDALRFLLGSGSCKLSKQ
jgi:predicted alpha/beta superfamily hydrolase